MGDCRDVLRDRVMERWALGGRYGGVGRSLHDCGLCDQSGMILPDRSQYLQDGETINCLEGEIRWLHVITIGRSVLACYGIRPREMERHSSCQRESASAASSQTRPDQGTLGIILPHLSIYHPVHHPPPRDTTLFPPLSHPTAPLRQCWTTSPLSPPRASCSGAAPTPRSPPTSSTA